VLVLVVLVGLNAAVTPVGSPEAVKATLSVKAFALATVIVLLVLLPDDTESALEELDSVKLGATTVKLIEVVLLTLPTVPVTVIVYVPAVADELAVKVNVLVLVVLEELNAAVTPVGSPEAVSATLLVKEFALVMVIVLLALFPTTAESALEELDSV
jgi:hypothetical protein